MATQLWEFQTGTGEADFLLAGVVGSNGTYVLAGYSTGDWDGINSGGKDFVVFKVDAQGDIIWKWQSGRSRNEWFRDIIATDDESVVMIGAWEENPDFYAVKVDVDGGVVWQWEDGTSGEDKMEAIAAYVDDSTILAGSTSGNWTGSNRGNLDFAAAKLDVNGNELWRWQNGTLSSEYFVAADVAGDGSVVLAGASSGNWSEPNMGGGDFAAVKIDSDGKEIWRWQGGTKEDDIIDGVAIGEDGSVLLTGNTLGNWSGETAGDRDFAACKLDANGTELWRWQNGSDQIDKTKVVFVEDDGSGVLIGITHGSWSGKSYGGVDLAAVKLDVNGGELWRWQNGTNGDDWYGGGSASRSTKSQILVAGSTSGSWATETKGGFDFTARLLDVSNPESASPSSVAPTQPPSSTLFPLRTSGPMPAPTPPPTPTTTTLIVASLSGAALVIAMMVAALVYRRRVRTRGKVTLSDVGDSRYLADDSARNACVSHGQGRQSRKSDLPQQDGSPSPPLQPKRTLTGATSSASSKTTSNAEFGTKKNTANALVETQDSRQAVHVVVGDQCSREEDRSSLGTQRKEGGENSPRHDSEGVHDIHVSSDQRRTPIRENRAMTSGIDVAKAVIAAAHDVARMSQIPGIAEVAGLVIVLMNLVTDSSNINVAGDYLVKRCRALLLLLQRAGSVLDEADNISETVHRVFIEDVRDAVGDLVEIIQTYKSKGRVSQVMMSTLFKRRQEEAEAIIDAAVCRLHLALQVQVGNKMNTLGQDVKKGLCLQLQGSERPEPDLSATNILEARRMRRQRNLDMVEIPEHFVTVTDELLGKGGFGAVYMADYNGRNAAAKVVKVDHDLGRINSLSEETTYGLVPLESKPGQDDSRRKAFWRELQAMRRLRSPHTVQLYGAITSCDDRLVLVMELLPGGDLRTLLKDALEPLDEPHARRIIGDVCAGMAFLHQKETIHGDLKSPNVLFDGFGRAKIGDFGTSKWPQLTNSTGLATYTTASSESTQMSYAWASPEVLESNCISYASDVYSFGVVVWEVLSRKIPWVEECRRSIYVRVAIQEHRPEIPVDSPPDLAKVVSACWDGVATNRPAFKDIMNLIPWQ